MKIKVTTTRIQHHNKKKNIDTWTNTNNTRTDIRAHTPPQGTIK